MKPNQRSSRLPTRSSNPTRQRRSRPRLSARTHFSLDVYCNIAFSHSTPRPQYHLKSPPKRFPQSFPHPPRLELAGAFPGACAERPLSTTLFLTIITVAIWPHAPPGRCPCSIAPIWCSCLCALNQYSDLHHALSLISPLQTDHLDQPSASTVKTGSANRVVKRSMSSILAASVVKKHGGVRGMCI